jgi:hypothetical protein
MAPNAVWATAGSRSDFGLPHRYVLIAEYDDSPAAALDCEAAGPDGECPVIRLWPGEEGDDLLDSEIAESFGAFFDAFVRERPRIFGRD